MPFLLTIRERNHSWAGRSRVTTTHGTRRDAEEELLDYVRRNWEAEVGTDEPNDPNERIAQYFASVLEEYEITETA
jgi:hypothetical protein